jgi:hypothetical protein
MVHRNNGPHALDGRGQGNFQVIPEICPRRPRQGWTILTDPEKFFKGLFFVRMPGLPVIGSVPPAAAPALGLGPGRLDGLKCGRDQTKAARGLRITGVVVGVVPPRQQAVTPAHFLQRAVGLHPQNPVVIQTSHS